MSAEVVNVQAARAGGSTSILVVDDDPDVRASVGEILEDQGYDVVLASHGREALQRLRNGRSFWLILLDIMMPVMNGWEFVAERSKDAELSRIPVVLLSADRRIAELARQPGISGYLAKPVALDDLLSTVARFAPKPS